MATITIKSGDTLSQIAKSKGTTISEILKLNPNIKDPNLIFAGANLNLPDTTTQNLFQQVQSEGVTNVSGQTIIKSGTQEQVNGVFTGRNTSPLSQVENIVPKNTVTPTIPAPTSTDTVDAYYKGLQTNLDNSRKAFEDSLKKQLADLDKREKASQAKIDEFSKKQGDIIKGDVKDILTPFRKDLQNTERDRLKINKNFQANQTLINELDTLLTQGNTLIEQQKNVTGLASIRNPRIAQTMSDVSARTGVIEAVLNARNGQIAQAQTMIDRSITAITADKNDQLTYYNALLDFYGGQKGDEKAKLVNITNSQKNFLDAQIGLLEDDLNRSQANADALKEAMTDPDTALAYAEAGITLNDTPAQRADKLSKYAYTKEVGETSNRKGEEGFQVLVPGQVAPDNSEVVTTTDSKGVTKTWWREKKAKDRNDNTIADKFIADNPDATRAEMKDTLLQNTNLSISEINAKLDASGVIKEDQQFDSDTINSIASGLVNSFKGGFLGFFADTEEGKKKAIEVIEAGTINIEIDGKTKTIELSARQKQEIIEAINKL